MSADESFISEELAALVGEETIARTVSITPLLVSRLTETMQDGDPRWQSGIAPPYVLLALETGISLPEVPAARESLVTGDEWTVYRPLRTGEDLRLSGGLASAHERFGSRFGHTLNLRMAYRFTDAAGETVAEAGRSMIRYATPARDDREEQRPRGYAPDPEGEEADPEALEQAGLADAAVPHVTPHPPAALRAYAEGDELPPAVLRPSLDQVVRYCGLTWAFVPFFYDPVVARRAGLPGTILPGPFKLALLSKYLLGVAGPDGWVRTVRAAHRRPDRTGRPLTIRGVVTRATQEQGRRVLDCEVWTENSRGERSVAGSAVIEMTAQG